MSATLEYALKKGLELHHDGRVEEATAIYRDVLERAPDHADALHLLGLALHQSGDHAGAIDAIGRAIDCDTGVALFHVSLGNAQQAAGRLDAAIASFRRAAEMDETLVEAHYNLGNALCAVADQDAAIESYRRAVGIAPNYADAWCNLGVALLARNQVEASLEALENALTLAPDLPDANWNKALALLLTGRYEEGWALYEWRFKAVPWLEKREFPQPAWDGVPLDGKTILIHAEQGYGDTLQFVRCLPQVVARGGKVVLACQPALKRLLVDLPGIEAVTAYGEPPAPFDVHLPIMSLPRVLDLRADAIEDVCPYLVAPEGGLKNDREGGFKVGLNWRGSRINESGMFRSCELSDLLPVLGIEGVAIYGLQVDTDEAERAALARQGIVDLGTGFEDFANSAQAFAQLDLIITVDTAAAHLAGGLGKPVWTLLAFAADWRWGLASGDTPWYPSMRLFRQSRAGDWSTVMQDVAGALAGVAADVAERSADDA